jgi:hypothetical protein
MNHQLLDRFSAFAESECKGSSPLYYALSRSIARDDLILDIAAQSAPGQPVPNLLFAAVQYLLFSGTPHSLSAFYATCSPSPSDPREAYPHFRDFVLGHSSEVTSLLKSRLVQTNEVRRSAYLLPALSFAANCFDFKPLALIEIGTSAGLNLLWDKYQYSYGDSVTYGDLSSEVLVISSFRGAKPSILKAPLPKISHRIGLDLNIVDTSIPDQVAWLRALIWPEHHERRALMDAALKKRREIELDFRVGDGFSMVSDLVKEIPKENVLCVYHTHVANQISQEARQSFLERIDRIGAKRDIIHISNNIKPHLYLTAYREGERIDMPLANTDSHAHWIEWLQKDENDRL